MTRDELNRRNGFIDGHAVVRSYPWRTVTGEDFGKAIKWARKQANKLVKQADEQQKEKKHEQR